MHANRGSGYREHRTSVSHMNRSTRTPRRLSNRKGEWREAVGKPYRNSAGALDRVMYRRTMTYDSVP